VINEAVELARRFSGEEAVEFVNGVLDGVWKKEAAAKSRS
jgi:transcription termination factor NusB